jgi:hypothetical protein
MQLVSSVLVSRKVLVAAVALAVALVVASPVAASGAVGEHGLTEVTCNTPKRMVAHFPYVAAAPAATSSTSFTVGGSWGGGTNLQWIGVRIWLVKANPVTGQWQLTDQNRDGYFDRTAEFRLQSTSNGPHVGANWWNADAGRYALAGDNAFAIQEPGSYSLMTQYFWYTNGQLTGYDFLQSTQHFVAEYYYTAKRFCSY